MKKLLLIFLLMPLLAQAAQWVKVGGDGSSEAFIDKSSILRSGGQFKVWSLVSYDGEQTAHDGTVYRSMKALQLYACGARTTTLLSQVYYAEAKGKGPVVQRFKYEKFEAEDIIPDSTADGALQLICKARKR